MSISCTANAGRVGGGFVDDSRRDYCTLVDGMEADVVRWLQCLRYAVAEESEPWNPFSAVYRRGGGGNLDSTVDALFDFNSTTTTSVSDFEYYDMSDRPATEDGELLTVDDDDCDGQNSVFMMFPNSDNVSVVSFVKPEWWSDVMAWKNELRDSALDETLSEEDEEQVLHRIKIKF